MITPGTSQATTRTGFSLRIPAIASDTLNILTPVEVGRTVVGGVQGDSQAATELPASW
jgi:hypothetical protein